MQHEPKIAILRWEVGHVPEGLMQLETMPGNSTNLDSYPFPVKLVEVPGANANTVIINPDPKVLENIDVPLLYWSIDSEDWSLLNTEKVRKKRPSKEDRRAMRAAGVKLRNKAAVAAWYAEKAIKAEEARLAAEEQARLDRLANPTTEDLLKDIRSLLQRLAPEDEAKIE